MWHAPPTFPQSFDIDSRTRSRQPFPPNATMHVDRFNSRTGDWVYHTPIAPSFNYLLTTPPAPNGQPLPIPGYPHPSYVTTPGLYPAAPQPWVVSPSPTSSSSVVVPLVPAPSREKNTGKYYVWEKFTNEDGRAVWIHTVSGKRTLVDPYK